MRILPSGGNALLLELEDLQEVRSWHAALEAACLPAVVDLVPAARTLLVVVDRRLDVGSDERATRNRRHSGVTAVPTLDAVADLVRGMQPDACRRPEGSAEPLEVPVVYDGDDLADVAALLGCSERAVVDRHTSQLWTVAFGGFAPGFGYLVPDGPPWAVPRRETPRTRVPAGAVGLAGPYTGVYPRASPGGWQLVGSTPVELFDVRRDPPALLTPGRRVRFVEVADVPMPSPRVEVPASPREPGGVPAVTVLATGALTTLQDEGRPGLAAIGVSPSGAADRSAYRLANRLVGNRCGAAAFEVTAGGFALLAHRQLLVAVTGAACRGAPHNASLWLRPGDELRMGMPNRGLRTYVALRGGVEVPTVLGSRATDVLSGLGPDVVRVGDRVALADLADELPPTDVAPVPDVGVAAGDTLSVRVAAGPRLDWLEPGALRRLTDATYVVTAESNRVGVRLDGQRLGRVLADELPSEGLLRGAVQVPPSGLPLVFLADHPTTGGYPVVAYVVDEDLDAVAQLRPGDSLRFQAW